MVALRLNGGQRFEHKHWCVNSFRILLVLGANKDLTIKLMRSNRITLKRRIGKDAADVWTLFKVHCH